MMRRVSEPGSSATGLPRVGLGVDVHRYADGAPLHLAGLAWPDEPRGLEGHSDADVAAHALCDAVLSAAGLGDLGSQFGTVDPQWAGASGTALLEETARRVRAAGFRIGNAAVQVIGNRPAARPAPGRGRGRARRGHRRAGVGLGDHHRRAGPHRPRRGRRRSRHCAGGRGLSGARGTTLGCAPSSGSRRCRGGRPERCAVKVSPAAKRPKELSRIGTISSNASLEVLGRDVLDQDAEHGAVLADADVDLPVDADRALVVDPGAPRTRCRRSTRPSRTARAAPRRRSAAACSSPAAAGSAGSR